MVNQTQTLSAQRKELSKRQERAHRILDAASALILRWGYSKTTIDDIARRAGVAKGTIYLHWKTREELFRALIHRERLTFAEDFKRRITADLKGATLRGIMKHSAMAILKRPLLKALFLRDRDILGKLAQGEYSNVAFLERAESFKSYLMALREHNFVRTDLSLQAQVHIVSVVYVGFFFGGPMLPDEFVLPDEEVAELLAETIHRTLETDHVISPEELEPVTRGYLESIDHYMALYEKQFQQELQGPA